MSARRIQQACTRLVPGLLFALALGCDREQDGASGADRPAVAEAGEGPPAGEPRDTAGAMGSTLPRMSVRLAERVREAVEAHRRRLASHGLLLPGRTRIVLSSKARCPRDTALLSAVEPAVLAALSRIHVVDAVREGPSERDVAMLELSIVTSFDAAFDRIRCRSTLTLPGGAVMRQVDEFADLGLIRIRRATASSGAQTFIVRARKGDFSTDLSVAEQEWFILPIGEYDVVAVECDGETSEPGRRVGLQNLWDFSPGRHTEPEPVPAARHRGTIETRAPRRAPRLAIASPCDGQLVGRVAPVSGISRGLSGMRVRVIVYADRGYEQDGSAIPDKSGSWRIPGCIFGRGGSVDKGVRFRVQAVARGPDGSSVRSDVIEVRRR
jgi:hypothetical protein